jgi:hypothetical protein
VTYPRRRVQPGDIRVGGFYVNEGKQKVREVWQAGSEPATFHWRGYWLDTGQPTGDGLVCNIWSMSRWADREATPEEISRLDVEYGRLADIAKTQDFVMMVLKNVPDDLLLEEARSRGLIPPDD